MLDSTSTPVIIDFDSCRPPGERIVGKGGTPGWTNNADIAADENDWYGLNKIELWLLRGGKEEHVGDEDAICEERDSEFAMLLCMKSEITYVLVLSAQFNVIETIVLEVDKMALED